MPVFYVAVEGDRYSNDMKISPCLGDNLHIERPLRSAAQLFNPADKPLRLAVSILEPACRPDAMQRPPE